jgi:hypothetical protein
LCQETARNARRDERPSSKKANGESVAASSASLRQEDETTRVQQEIFLRWEAKVFDMNPDIVAGGILAGPGMAEGGAFKKQRDAFTMHVALKHKVADSMLDL